MAKKKAVAEESEGDRRGFFQVALKLYEDGAQVAEIRKQLGLSKADAAKKAKMSVAQVTAFERPGKVRGNFWLFCYYIQSNNIDPRLIGIEHYLDETLEADPRSRRREGKIVDRDNWFEWSGPEFRKLRRWAHRKYIEKMPDKEREKPRTRPQIKKWFDEWDSLKRPDAQEIEEES